LRWCSSRCSIAGMNHADPIAQHILAMERTALNRWGAGDPGGYLDISASDVSYFDPFQPGRIDGHAGLSALYATIRGKIKIDHDEIVEPRVQLAGDAAVLTFVFVSHGSEGARRWNCTEVYERRGDQWQIIHSHWSFVQPTLA
jgi:Calcium/calmodulin dependent protein kinase II association domain